jgi:hypothetical protein
MSSFVHKVSTRARDPYSGVLCRFAQTSNNFWTWFRSDLARIAEREVALELYATCYLDNERFQRSGASSSAPPDLYVDLENPVFVFLDNCFPPMWHLVPIFRALGITTQVELIGLGEWGPERLYHFFRRNRIGRSPFEVDVLIAQLTAFL